MRGETNSIAWSQECGACSGTGLYIGIAEWDGAAVVCRPCGGSGKLERRVFYRPFIQKHRRDNVTQVYRTAAGIVLAPDVVPGGASYEEWLEDPEIVNLPGREIRQHACPKQWHQSTDSDECPDWDECRGVGAFKDCRHFPTKYRCWARWDEEQGHTPTI